jgi:hypothetical protein
VGHGAVAGASRLHHHAYRWRVLARLQMQYIVPVQWGGIGATNQGMLVGLAPGLFVDLLAKV